MNKQAFLRFGKIALDVALVCLVLGVIVQNRFLAAKLKGQEDILKGPERSSEVAVGGQVRNLAAANLDGVIEPIAVPEAGQKLLIIGMSPHYSFCNANQTGWIALASTLRQRGGRRVLWISRDPIVDTRQYFSALGTPLSDAMADPPFRTYEQLGLRIVPRAIAVSSGGRVDRVWEGQLTMAAWKEVFSYFGLVAPKSFL